MIPAGEPTRQTITELKGLLEPGDLVIDGGNSHYTEDQEHARMLGEAGIHFVDVGVSGGVWGLQNGYGLMVGGDDADVNRVMPIFEALKPEGEYGFVHAGKVGAGPLRQDGPQRHRVRHHAGLRRGLRTARGHRRGDRRGRCLLQLARAAR